MKHTLGWWKRQWLKLREQWSSKPQESWNVAFDDCELIASRLTMRPEVGTSTVRWDEVTQVSVFKRDLTTIDQICVRFRRADGSAFEFTEDVPRFLEVIAALPQYLPGCPALGTWYLDVMQPPFEANYRVLWDREDAIEGHRVEASA